MRNNPIKNERKMKNYIIMMSALLFADLLLAINPTSPNSYLDYYSGDFTDTDGDGMTDVAEIKYGFDPNDSNSFPAESYVVTSKYGKSDTDGLGSDSDTVYFKFTNFSKVNEQRTTDFLIKLIPIMKDVVGNPAETFVCELYNRGGSHGSWMCVNSGRKMLCDDSWNPRLLVHELIHVWKGKYDFTSMGKNWGYAKKFSGFEESAEGMAYEILHDYVEAYPTDDVSIKTLEGGAWENWAVKAGSFDLSKHQEFLSGGDFWVDNLSHYDRYNASAVLVQIFQKHDENFFRKMLAKFYDMIEANPDYRPSRGSIIDLWASIVPMINGIPTKQYLNALPILNSKKLPNEFFAISLNDGKFYKGGKHQIYCAFADKKKGEFWWSSPVREWNVESKYGIPSWFGKFLGSDGYYYTDNRNQPYVVDVKDVFNQDVKSVSGTLYSRSNSDGSPSSFATSTPSDLYGDKFEVGLYTQTLSFPNYSEFTEKYKEDFYFFGYKNFEQNKHSDYSVFVGIDAPLQTEVTIVVDGQTYTETSKNGCAVFMLNNIAQNYDGVFQISVSSSSKTNHYVRTLLNAGTRDNYRHQTFLIIDKNFNGVEDLYETEEIIVDNVDTNVDVNQSTEIAIDFNNTNSDDTNIVVDNTTESNQTTEVVFEDVALTDGVNDDSNVTINVDDNQSILVDNTDVKIDVQEFAFDLNVSFANNGIEIKWNDKQDSEFYLELKLLEDQLIYGNHKRGFAFLNFNEHNFTGNEILNGRFLEYKNNEFVEYSNEFVVYLSDYFSTEPIIVQVETNNSVVIVDGVIAIEMDDSNTTIINTEDNVILVEDTQNVQEYNDANSTLTSDDNVIVIVDDNVTLYTDDGTHEANASDSVIVVTDTEITIDEDTSKNSEVKFGGVAPSAPNAVKSIWDNAISIGSNWYYIEWFGYFFKVADNSWIYHETFGWLYADFTVSSESVWFYHDQLGWLWTSSSYFPYVYNVSSQTWFYFVEGGYYDFSKQSWIQNS